MDDLGSAGHTFGASILAEILKDKYQNIYLLLLTYEDTILRDSFPTFSKVFAAKRLEPVRATAPNMIVIEQGCRTVTLSGGDQNTILLRARIIKGLP